MSKREMKRTIIGQRFMELVYSVAQTQEEFAKSIGKYPSAITEWLSGRSIPNGKTIVVICNKYNVSADWLLGLSDKRER